MIAFAWLLFGAFVLGVLLFSYAIVKYYQDGNEAEILPTWASVLGLSVALFCVLLIPVDIYSVSSTGNHETGEKSLSPDAISARSESVRILYYILYSAILALAFGIIPFAYFYHEEQDEETDLKQRIWGGCKYTFFLLAIVSIMLIIGLVLFFVKPGDKPTSTDNASEWAKGLVEHENVAEAAISFSIACLTLLGYMVWFTYTAYGLSSLPIGLIKGKKHVAEEYSLLQNDIETTRTKANSIKSKYLGGKKPSKKDSEQLDLLKRRERALSRQNSRLESENSGCNRCLAVFKPFLFIFGIVFFLLSLLIIVSILLTTIDKAVHSSNFCGSRCGFVLAYPEIFNPVDTLLSILARYFPLDYVVLALCILYIFFSTLSGIFQIGIRFIWIHLYKVRKGATPPQGMLLTCVILMLAILALNMQVTTLAPQYASWGSQTYYNATSGKVEPCSLDAPMGNCTMTQIGTFVNRISIRTNFFGIMFFYGTWVFLAAFFIGSIVAMFKAKPNNIEARESDSDEDES